MHTFTVLKKKKKPFNGKFWLGIVSEKFQRNQTDMILQFYRCMNKSSCFSLSTILSLLLQAEERRQPPSFSSLSDTQHLHPVVSIHSSDLRKKQMHPRQNLQLTACISFVSASFYMIVYMPPLFWADKESLDLFLCIRTIYHLRLMTQSLASRGFPGLVYRSVCSISPSPLEPLASCGKCRHVNAHSKISIFSNA